MPPAQANAPHGEEINDRKHVLFALGHDLDLPRGAVLSGFAHPEDIEPKVLELLASAQHEFLDITAERLLFRGLHILGARRRSVLYRPLLEFLSAPLDRVEAVLGDAVTETLARILAGVFDGDATPLYRLVLNSALDAFVRGAGLGALGVLAFERRIDRGEFESCLAQMQRDELIRRDDDPMWCKWAEAIAFLGAETLVPLVLAAFADGRIAIEFFDEEEFDAVLRDALERPDDRDRLLQEQLGYIDDVVAALERFSEASPNEGEDFPSGLDRDFLEPDVTRYLENKFTPAHNVFRDVGRNDPCPCGSGKKFKKCCLDKLQS